MVSFPRCPLGRANFTTVILLSPVGFLGEA
jgi:hypothetical protein